MEPRDEDANSGRAAFSAVCVLFRLFFVEISYELSRVFCRELNNGAKCRYLDGNEEIEKD